MRHLRPQPRVVELVVFRLVAAIDALEVLIRNAQFSDRLEHAEEMDLGRGARHLGRGAVQVVFPRDRFRERLVRQRRQLPVQPAATDESGQRARGEGAAAEAEQENAVARAVVFRQPAIGFADRRADADAEEAAEEEFVDEVLGSHAGNVEFGFPFHARHRIVDAPDVGTLARLHLVCIAPRAIATDHQIPAHDDPFRVQTTHFRALLDAGRMIRFSTCDKSMLYELSSRGGVFSPSACVLRAFPSRPCRNACPPPGTAYRKCLPHCP